MFLHDLRDAARIVRRAPGFSLAAVLTLGLGLGANTAMFGVVNAVLLRPLPYERASRLVQVATVELETGRELSVSYPDALDWRREPGALDEVAAVGAQALTLTGSGPASQIDAELVSANYFPTLGVEPEAGRTFVDSEDTPGSGAVVVVSDRLWRARFGADPRVVGSALVLNDVPYDVVGIAPRGFRGYTADADLWVPLGMFDTVNPSLRQYNILGGRNTRWLSVVGRLTDGQSIPDARSALDIVAGRLARAHPESNAGKGVRVVSARQALVGDLRVPLLVVLGAAGLLLLVACANIATLLLAQGSIRAREFAVRVSLGAGPGQIVRQLLSESVVLGLCAAGVGLALAAWTLDAVSGLNVIGVPSFILVDLDRRAIGFTLLAAIATTVLFGLVPAVGISRRDPLASLGGAAATARGHRGLSGQALFVVVQIALALSLAAGAGLMVRSVVRMQAFEPGFESARLATMRVSIPAGKYPDDRSVPLRRELLRRLEAEPTVESAAFSSHVYFGGGYLTTRLVSEDGEPGDVEGWAVHRQFIGPGYTETLGIPLIRGRVLDARDRADAPPVALVSESLARRLWPSGRAVGQRIAFDPSASERAWLEVVGVVGDVTARMTWTTDGERPQVYTPMQQAPVGATLGLVVRAVGEPAAAMDPVRRAIAAVDADIPVFRQATMTELLREQTGRARFVMGALGLFALLAAIGIAGVVSRLVTSRVKELGLRIALGAEPTDVLRLVLWQAAGLTTIGVACGLAGATVASRLLTALLFGVTPGDAPTLGMVTVVLLVVSLVASYLPARRAVRIDPIAALRE